MLYYRLILGSYLFANPKSKNRFDAAKKTLHLSKIFDWYEEDFIKSDLSVAQYAGRYLPKEVQVIISTGTVEVKHLSYDWSLNGN